MQKLFKAREEARKKYVAARHLVLGALALDADESIKQLMPAISSMYGSGRRTVEEEDEEPVEA